MANLRVVCNQRYHNQEIRHVHHYGGGGWTQANMPFIVADFKTAYSHLQTAMSTAWQLYSLSVKDVSDPANPYIEYPFIDGPLVGSNAEDSVAPQLAAIVSWLAYTARPNRGRNYIGGFTEGWITAGQFTQAFQNMLSTWAQAMIDLPSDTGFAGAKLIARFEPTTGVYVGSNIIEAYRVNAIPGTQRRRRVGVGI